MVCESVSHRLLSARASRPTSPTSSSSARTLKSPLLILIATIPIWCRGSVSLRIPKDEIKSIIGSTTTIARKSELLRLSIVVRISAMDFISRTPPIWLPFLLYMGTLMLNAGSPFDFLSFPCAAPLPLSTLFNCAFRMPKSSSESSLESKSL
ncbi:MAG: hypothetical protein BWY62_01007 [Firmicutes bacterium ADurb.Bin356]|nr:MAG: hypothetical protein BWY62_01007 [Firmicutes bacterium ADurb.Bin356]